MNKRWIWVILFAVVLFLLVPMTVWGATLYVGPGQTYNGTTQDVINQAIQDANAGDTVYLRAATYNITGPIILKSGITLRGDGGKTVIHAAGDNVCNNPSSETGSAYVIGNDVSNVTICNLRFTSTADEKNDGGHGDGRNCIQFRRAQNCEVYNVIFSRWLFNDGVRVSKSNGISVHDCEINAGHDGICFYASQNCKAYNNQISVQINNGIRANGSSNVEIHNNNFTSRSDLGGWCCVQIQGNARNVNIHHNIFYDTAGKIGVAPYDFSGSNIQVHDNVFWNCVTPIQVGSGSNNIVNPSDRNLGNWVQQGYGRSINNSNIPAPSGNNTPVQNGKQQQQQQQQPTTQPRSNPSSQSRSNPSSQPSSNNSNLPNYYYPRSNYSPNYNYSP
ncbi:MAG TPA: glycosyl hydrolase family 28-related protein, partial [Peptococcaceae bacterium]|nr:glycosyl hydrolase family 28-related protein [Peptococcaceae bacterium]